MNSPTLDPQAIQLNETIAASSPEVMDLLSRRGKAIFFPKLGILSQSAEANGKDINATIGIAKENNGTPMFLNSVNGGIQLPPAKVYPYAPSFGTPEIRKLWKDMQFEKNPGLKEKTFSLPVVTHALTHALSVAGYLFLDPEDTLIVPDMYWENYDLTFTIGYGARIETFKTFTEDGGFNVAGLEKNLNAGKGRKIVLLNFPNNPTGYTPLDSEVGQMVNIFKSAAQGGQHITVLLDDAYFGLVFEEGVYKQSMFADLCDLHPNLLAVKMDGPTKEDYVWGIRVGFITFGIRGGTPAMYQALEAKAAGAVRGTISNASHLGQSMLTAAWSSDAYSGEKQEKYDILKERYLKIKSILAAHPEYAEAFVPTPFNSGYFMCLKMKKGNAEAVRQKLLSDFSTGTIAFGDLVRLAFSSTPISRLEELFENVYKAAKAV